MANKLYVAPETSITWTDSGGDEIMDLGSTDGNAGAGCVGEEHDFGAGSHAEWYFWQLIIDGFDTAPVVGEEIEVYMAWSIDGTVYDGPVLAVSGADLTLASTDLLKNMKFLGSAVVRSTTAADDIVASGVCRIPTRYCAPVVFNNTADKLLSTADAHKFILQPIPPELQ